MGRVSSEILRTINLERDAFSQKLTDKYPSRKGEAKRIVEAREGKKPAQYWVKLYGEEGKTKVVKLPREMSESEANGYIAKEFRGYNPKTDEYWGDWRLYKEDPGE